MATGSHLTVRDYFDQVLFGYTAKKGAISSVKADASGKGSFHRILTSCGNRRLDPGNLKPTGLTAVDYLKNPVRVKCQFNHRLSSTAPTKKETKADSSPGLSTPLPARQTTDTNTAPSDLKKTPQACPDSSVPIFPNNQTGSNESLIIESSIHRAARRYSLPPGLIKGVIRAESNFQVGAVSQAGAQGLMQLMPATAKALGVRNPFNIDENIDGGARYLRQMLDSFGGDVKVALAAYNAGPGAVEKYGGRIPPYQETERYINRVLEFSKLLA
jgi:Transglycosylase SLT domain